MSKKIFILSLYLISSLIRYRNLNCFLPECWRYGPYTVVRSGQLACLLHIFTFFIIFSILFLPKHYLCITKHICIYKSPKKKRVFPSVIPPLATWFLFSAVKAFQFFELFLLVFIEMFPMLGGLRLLCPWRPGKAGQFTLLLLLEALVLPREWSSVTPNWRTSFYIDISWWKNRRGKATQISHTDVFKHHKELS